MPKKSTNVNLAQLLKEVSRHPALWQPHHADFNNRSSRAELWRNVAMRVVPNFEECKDKVKLVASVSRRWRYQQDNMLRCMRNNQTFQHEREMCYLVPILRARIAEENANERVRNLRRRTESTRDALNAHRRTVAPIRIVTRSHTTIGSQRLPAAKKPPTANATSTGAKPAAATRYATAIATSGAATKKRKANPPQEAVISAAPAKTTTETPATTTTETPATTTTETPATTTTETPASATGATSTMPLHQMSPGPGEPSVAQGVIPPDQPMVSPVAATNLIIKEEFDDEHPDLQLLATLDLRDLSIDESKDTELSQMPPDTDQAFTDLIKAHMRDWSVKKKLDFQYEVMGLLRRFQ